MFCIKLAGIPIAVHAAYDSTKDFCKEYLTEETPLFSVAVEQKHIRMIRERDRKNAENEGRSYQEKEDAHLEKLALADVLMEKLIRQQVLLFHGSVMAAGGQAYLFTACSGTGKTTHCNLWFRNFPESYILNGDKPLLLFRDGIVYACGSPWMGKENNGFNVMLPLGGICILERDGNNHIEEIPMADSFDALLRQCHIPDGRGTFAMAVSLLRKLSAVKLYRLGCNMEDEAAFVSYNAMVKHEHENL